MSCAELGSGTSHGTRNSSSLHRSVHRVSCAQQGPRWVSVSIWYSLIGQIDYEILKPIKLQMLLISQAARISAATQMLTTLTSLSTQLLVSLYDTQVQSSMRYFELYRQYIVRYSGVKSNTTIIYWNKLVKAASLAANSPESN